MNEAALLIERRVRILGFASAMPYDLSFLVEEHQHGIWSRSFGAIR